MGISYEYQQHMFLKGKQMSNPSPPSPRSWNKMILAILNLYVAPMPPIKFQLNPTNGLGGDVILDFQYGRHRGHLGYRNGMTLSLLSLNVAQIPHHVWAQSDLGFVSRCGFKIFKMASQAAFLDSRMELQLTLVILTSLILILSLMSN